MNHLLTIAGSDCSGGAGIQADLKTFAAHGAYGMSVIVSVVAENTNRLISVRDMEADTVRDQMDAVFEDIRVDGVKVGMLPNNAVMHAVAEKLRQYRAPETVIDPVMATTGGCVLMREEARDTLISEMLPLAYLLTPNILEAENICGFKIKDIAAMRRAAAAICEMGAENVLIKGGHLRGDAVDILFDGRRHHAYASGRIDTKHTHGTGCTLSSAITANIAEGKELTEAVRLAKEYITGAIAHAFPIGKGSGPTHHFYRLWRK